MKGNIFISSVALAVIGCGSAPNVCESFPSEYTRVSGNLELNKSSALMIHDKSMVREIQICYRQKPYQTNTEIQFDKLVIAGNHKYFIFDVLGVTDVRLVYVVSPAGQIVAAHQYGMA